MKIELEVEDKEEFEKAINNAIIALNNIQSEINLMGFTKNVNFSKLVDKYGYDKCVEILENRLKILHDVYNQIQKI